MSTSNVHNCNETMQIKQQLIDNLQILHDGNAPHKPQQFQAANRFLMEFNKHSDAWNICLSILSEIDSSNISILRFSSQTIYNGLLQHWRTVTIQERVQIVGSLQAFTKRFCEKYLLTYLSNINSQEQQLLKSSFKFIFNKICQCIAFLALNAKQAPNMIESVLHSCASIQMPQQLSLLWVHFETLNAFALEFAQQHVSQTIISDTRSILTTKCRDGLLKSIMFALRSCKQYQNPLFRLMEIAFSTLKHWINIVDITLESMENVGLVQEVLSCISLLYKETKHLKAKQFIVEAMNKLVIKGILNKSNRQMYDAILDKISKALVTLQWNDHDMSNTQNICNLICGFCENEVGYVARGSDVCLQLIQIILRFTSHSSTMITTETFGFWSRLQDIAMSKRHQWLRKDVYIELLRALLLHSTDVEEFDEHSRFRENASEIFISIYFVLQKEYFVQIEKRLATLFNTIGSASNQKELDLIYVGIESCVFALNVIAQEVSDERDQMAQCLAMHIKPMCETLLQLFATKISNAKQEINATIFHLVTQITSLLRRYAFYIGQNQELLQKCLLFTIEIPTKHEPILAFECSKTFNNLLYHSIGIWQQHVTDFEQHIVPLVVQRIGNGEILYKKLSSNEMDLLKQSDETITNPIGRQNVACSVYYESLCMIIDVYKDGKRQQSAVDHLFASPIQNCTQIVHGNIDLNAFYALLCHLRIFCGLIRGLQTTKTTPHPIVPQITTILGICSTAAKHTQIKTIQTDNVDATALYDAVCDVIEAILDILGSSTGGIIDNLVQFVLDILKTTKSESAARILKKMVSTFSAQQNVNNNFVKLIDDCVKWLSSDDFDGDLREDHATVIQIFESVGIMIDNKTNDANMNYTWTQMVPNTIGLALKLLTNIQDREGLKGTLKLLKRIFEPKHSAQLRNISNDLKKYLLPNVISILFNGIAVHFERVVANKVYDVYYNLMQLDAQYVKEQTMQQLVNLKSSAFHDDENKKLFMNAFWAQRCKQRKFNLVMSTFFSVCHDFNTPDSFVGMIE